MQIHSYSNMSQVTYHTLVADTFQSKYLPWATNFALALLKNETAPNIINRIQKCFFNETFFFEDKEDPKSIFLNERFSEYKLMLLHLAAINGNDEAIESVLKNGADINAQDIYGFTALHHLAAQGRLKALKLLLSYGANAKLKTKDGATIGNLLDYNAPFRSASEWLSRVEKVQKNHKIDPSCVKENIQITDGLVATPQSLVDILWTFRPVMAVPDSPTLELNTHFFKKYLDFIKHPPSLSVRPSDSKELLEASSNPCGLFAQDPIPKGTIIGIYGGEMFLAFMNEDIYGKDRDSEYLFGGSVSIDAKKYRSLGAMANDGFPNAFIHSLSKNGETGVSGLPYVLCLIATENIKAGEEIFIDYGAQHAIKKSGHIEPRKEKLKEWFLKYSPKKMVEKYFSMRQSKHMDTYLDGVDILVKFSYLFSTPTIVEYLKNEGLFNDSDIEFLNSYVK